MNSNTTEIRELTLDEIESVSGAAKSLCIFNGFGMRMDVVDMGDGVVCGVLSDSATRSAIGGKCVQT